MKMKYVKPETTIEEVAAMDAVMLTMSDRISASSAAAVESKGRFDFEEETSATVWEDGLW